MNPSKTSIAAIVPAAGVGSRMQAQCPKQYLTIAGKTILEHTLETLLQYPKVDKVIVVVSENDPYFSQLAIATHPELIRVSGGKERADSVLAGLRYLQSHFSHQWVMVHDAARPCVKIQDIDRLISASLRDQCGAILATPVRDTMKRANSSDKIDHTVDRQSLWHALTPQMFPTQRLTEALAQALDNGVHITDEASVMERLGEQPTLVQGGADNIKITQPEDLALAEFYLNRSKG
ncbi:2-C-methyl-D-erythritol 4-phosphate cytidylyltransferase [Vibrio ostreicida]|uniref:2-C-methyl-D-erythritol 4-phosphate cytidylyltransferase n=1 Tax=Vibrio ostreicida TaxID=526588 RepID=A0ABT8BQ38_9VIBR|nr:2-C-methyl-D-erythritol 4-phosphate cytidylyltransferase [Vibrio ostreicida]MDN3609033.1 2-C-methyl-D-erythritol 4-phosphate cytidylyltransferase [Vibrio ostreicida]NPD07929.1 2-C-methyl-D-erythritol 4-phosphate cytidylyltransferase [Vibrio ostreicida]